MKYLTVNSRFCKDKNECCVNCTCRFYQGRRTADDERQIGRWLRCAGTTGRWRNNLISKCVRSGCGYDNHGVSPVVRQTLQHWGYKLNQEDFNFYAKKMKNK